MKTELTNPRLPILLELEQELREQLDAVYGVDSAGVAAGGADSTGFAPTVLTPTRPSVDEPVPRRHRRHRAREVPGRRRAVSERRRIATRIAALAAILGVAGGVAVANQNSDHSSSRPSSSPTVVASGTVAGSTWQLSAYRHNGVLCQLFIVDGTQSSVCASTLKAGELRATSSLDANSRFVTGLAGDGVARVRITVGGRTLAADTYAVSASQARSARLPSGLRWFVASLTRDQISSAQPADLQPLDTSGRPTGTRYLDCTIGQGTVPCLRLAEQEAR